MLLIGAGWALLAAFDLWLILIRPDAPWQTRISFLLGLVGVYTFAFGIVSAGGLLSWDPSLGLYLTSPNPTLLLAAILEVLSLLFSAVSVAFRPKRTSESLDRRGAGILYVIQTVVLFLTLVVLVPFLLVYVFLVAPLAWIAYAIVDVPLDSVLTSGEDMEIKMTTPEGERTITIKQLVRDHQVTLRNGLVAVPALVSSLVIGALRFV
jgi:hypothetical protein